MERIPNHVTVNYHRKCGCYRRYQPYLPNDFNIVLQSPDGTESWLAVSNGDSNEDYSDWLFNTVHHWGESSLGLWTLKVRDSTTGEWNSIRGN